MCWLSKLFKPERPPTLEAYDNWVRQQVGEVPRYETSWGEVKVELQNLGLRCMIKDEDIPDFKMFHTDETTLTKMIPFLTYPADYYVAFLEIDCDDYADWASADASRIFKISGVRKVWGWMPLGYHAWSISRIAPMRYKLFEPNAGFDCAGELFNFGYFGYNPNKWK